MADLMNDLLKALKQWECIITYKKLDTGELREMHCTLNPEIAPKAAIMGEQDPKSDNIVVWCRDKNDWRSFQVDTMSGWVIK